MITLTVITINGLDCMHLFNQHFFFLHLSQWQCCFYIKTTSGCLVIAIFYISPVKELFRFRTELNRIIRFHETIKSFFFLFINTSLALKGLCHLTFFVPFQFRFCLHLSAVLSVVSNSIFFCFHLSFFFFSFIFISFAFVCILQSHKGYMCCTR